MRSRFGMYGTPLPQAMEKRPVCPLGMKNVGRNRMPIFRTLTPTATILAGEALASSLGERNAHRLLWPELRDAARHVSSLVALAGHGPGASAVRRDSPAARRQVRGTGRRTAPGHRRCENGAQRLASGGTSSQRLAG